MQHGTEVDDFSSSSAAFIGHFAVNDPYEPQANVDHLVASLRRAGRPVTVYCYPGTGHWFFEPDRAEAYNQGPRTWPGSGPSPFSELNFCPSGLFILILDPSNVFAGSQLSAGLSGDDSPRLGTFVPREHKSRAPSGLETSIKYFMAIHCALLS